MRVFAARAAGADSWLETARSTDAEDARDLDLAALGAGPLAGARPTTDAR